LSDRPTFRARIRDGESMLGGFANLGSALTAELLGRAGYDWVILDLEHGLLSETTLLSSLHAVEANGATPVVRVEEGTRLRIGRVLDLGARALMVPRVDSAEDAARVVGYTRYPPTGARGVALPTRFGGYGTLSHADVGQAHEDICLMIQVESEQAVDAAPETAAIDGVDVLFVGPTDLSHSLGIPGDIGHPRYRNAIERIGRAAADHGKQAGVLVWSLDDMPAYVDAGYRVIAAGSDGGFVATSARALVKDFRTRFSG
jgi:2-keto-3-deoxy-L-rhamnonate aldolase RhmA